LQKLAPKNELHARLLYLLRERDPTRELGPFAQVLGVSVNSVRQWEDPSHSGEIPYHQQLKYLQFFGSHPGLCLYIAELAQLAHAGETDKLRVLAKLGGLVVKRVLEPDGAPDLTTVAARQFGLEKEYDAILVEFLLAINAGDPRRERDVFRDLEMIERYKKYAAEAQKEREEEKRAAKSRKVAAKAMSVGREADQGSKPRSRKAASKATRRRGSRTTGRG
jgi:hypothetical protein